MSDNQRIEDLRRRVQKDPASIAFAQLAEECRRAGQNEESIEVCRAGLAIHPGYLSARVTLGRALLELDQLDEAQTALELVLKSAGENLAAIRGLAEIHHRRGSLPEALAQYRAALALARNDPDLQQIVAELARKVEPPKPPASDEGLSFEQMASEFLQHSPPPAVPPAVPDVPVVRLKPDATNTNTSTPDATSALTPDATSALTPDATSALTPDATSTLTPDATSTLTLDATSALTLDAASRLTPDFTDTLPAPRSTERKPDSSDTAEADRGRPAADPFAFLQYDSAQASPFDSAAADPLDSAAADPLDSAEASPFDFADASALDSAEANPFDSAEASPFDSTEASPFDFALGSPFDSAQGRQAAALQSGEDTAARQLSLQTIAALEQWLDAIHVTRAQRFA